MQKSEIISIIFNDSTNSNNITQLIDYLKSLYRRAFEDNEWAKGAVLHRDGYCGLFEVYYLDENDLVFKRKDIIALYTKQKKFVKENFREVKICK